MAGVEKLFVGNEKDAEETVEVVQNVLLPGEEVRVATKGLRDGFVLTNRRILTVNKQGLTGRKIQILSLSLKAVTGFAIENNGTFDLDAELTVYGSGYGKLELSFLRGFDMRKLAVALGELL